MIMGAGKTTVIGPLLTMLLADANTLMIEVVPNALLDFSANVLRERFSTVVRKPVFTFTFDRYQEVTLQQLYKLRTARNLRAVIVSTPTAVKSFMLKFLEIVHLLDMQHNLAAERRERVEVRSRLSRLLGFSRKIGYTNELSATDIAKLREQANISRMIFDILRGSIEIMDEVDLLLHPLRSELNWPLGAKAPLDFTHSSAGNGLRWGIPAHLLDAVFACSGMPILAEMADSREACKFVMFANYMRTNVCV